MINMNVTMVFRRYIPFNSLYGIRNQCSFVTQSILPHAKNRFPGRRFASERGHMLRDIWETIRNKVSTCRDISRKLIHPTVYAYMRRVGIILMPLVGTYYAFLNDFPLLVISIVVGKLSSAINKAEVKHSRSPHYIARPKIEKEINKALTYDFLTDDGYTIVYGPKGVGKTEIVDHTAIGKKAVVKVKVSSANTKGKVAQSVIEVLLGYRIGVLNSMLLMEAVRRSAIIPTIIFDVEPSVSSKEVREDVVDAVRSLSKELAPYCRCIIVLSEASAVLQFGKDDQEEFIYVDEIERDEAKQLLAELKTNLSEADMNYVFTNIGTDPVQLIKLAKKVSSTYSVKDYVADVLKHAEGSLLAFPHQQILKALKQHPEGVSPKYFKKQMHNGVDLSYPVAVGAAMKSVNAIVYRKELHKYVLMSTAHRTALKSYDPIVSK